MPKRHLVITYTLIFASTNIEKMLTTLLFTVIILVISVVLLSIKVLLKKGGRFPNTHIEGNRALGKKGIFCAKTMDRMAVKQKGLYDIMNEIKE